MKVALSYVSDNRALLARFVAVGVFNTLLGYGLYAAFLYLGANYAAANFGAIVISVPVGFVLHRKFVFVATYTPSQFVRFVLAWAAIYGISTLLIKLLIGLGLTAYWAGLIVLPLNTVLSFLANRYLVFQKTN